MSFPLETNLFHQFFLTFLMGSMNRSTNRVQLWKKAVVHFSLCFVMGFFTGFAPTGKSSSFSNRAIQSNKTSPYSPQTIHQLPTNFNRSLIDETPLMTQEPEVVEKIIEKEEEENKLSRRKLIIIVTPMSTRDRFGGVFLRKLACSVRLVPPPLLWIVLEKQSGLDEISKMLRKTGIMYRHLVFEENFTDPETELDHQRNIALKHIEQHRLSGIVHFAGIYNVYDLGFFDKLRGIEVFGTWPTALLSASKKKVIIKGPVCDSSQVLGWHIRKINNPTDTKPPIHVSSFGFNSSILWDPERWGRPSSSQQTSQNSIKYVKEVAVEDETKLKGIPLENCSRIMLWRFHFPILTSPITTTHPLTSGR